MFETFKNGLKKSREFMTANLNRMAAGLGIFDDEMLDELEMMLIQADCGMTASTEAIEAIREHIRLTGDASRESVLAVLKSSLGAMMAEKTLTVKEGMLSLYLMVGVNGTGKTTTAAKLAQRAKEKDFRVMMAAADTFRAAAIEQLKVWGERTRTTVIAHAAGSDPAAVVFDAIQAAHARKTELLIVDTAGRLHTKKNLMDELGKIRRVIDREAPDAVLETILVIDATTGQNAVVQAKEFGQSVPLSGLVLTKMDGTAKGGIIFAIATEQQLPVKLIGVGEGMDDLRDFDPQEFVRALFAEVSS